MYSVKIFDQSLDKLRIDENRSCIDLYAYNDFVINPNQIYMLSYNIRMELGNEVIAVPYSKDRKFNLYYPNNFGILKGVVPNLQIQLDGRCYESSYKVEKGKYIATYRFMTIQFHELMKAHKDKGLRSAFIKIELSNG